MKKILLAVIIFISGYTASYATCSQIIVQLNGGVSPVTLCEGTPLTLSGNVIVTSAPMNGFFTYSWIKGNVVLQTATINITPSIATAVPSYTGITGQLSDAGDYILRVEDGNAGNSVCYKEASIVVNIDPPVIAPTISADQTICAGTAPAMIVGSTITGGMTAAADMYVWQSSDNGSTGWAIITGSTSKDFAPGTLTTDKYYKRSDTKGVCPSVESNIIKITVTTDVTVSSDKNLICPNNPVVFTANAPNADPATLYEWFIDNTSQGAPTSSPQFSKTDLSTSIHATVVLTNSNLACPVSAYMYVNVTTGISAGTITSDQTICYNSVPAPITQLTAPTNIRGLPTYTWEASATGISAWVTIPGATNATYTPVTAITQDVYIRRVVTDGGTPAPCNIATSNAVHITVRPQLIAGVIGSDETICAGTVPSTITQTTSPTGGTGFYTYQWESDASGTFAAIPGAINSNYISPALTATTKFMRVETSTTCGSVTSNVITKTATTAEVVTAVIDNTPTQVCAGSQAIVFTANGSTTTGTGTLHYLWQLGGSPVGTDSPAYIYSPVSASDNGKVLQVIVRTSNGCNSGSQSDNYILDIVPATTPTITTTTDAAVTCAGLPVTFTATSTRGGPMPVYQWYVVPSGAPNSAVGNAVGTTGKTYSSSTLADGDRVYVELTSSVGCIIGTNPFKSNEITMIVKPLPTPVINEGDQTVCAPNAFTYTANVNAVNTYQWLFNGNIIPGAINDSHTASQTGAYSILEDNGTCSATSAEVALTIDPCGAFSTRIMGPNPITSGQQNAVYSVVNQSGFSYLWSITGGTIVSGQNTNSVTVDWDAPSAVARTTATGYSISVIETNTSNQTKKTKLNINTLTTGTTQSLAQSGINVFPNPTSGAFNITMPESGVDVTYEILDITGLSVASGTFTSTGGDQKIDADLSAGMYQIILKYNDVVTCARLSKVQ